MPSQTTLEAVIAERNVSVDKDIKPKRIIRLTNQSHGPTEVPVRQGGKQRNTSKLVFCLLLSLSFFISAQKTILFAQKTQSKADLTPTFWQRDPDADFEDEGRMHCA